MIGTVLLQLAIMTIEAYGISEKHGLVLNSTGSKRSSRRSRLFRQGSETYVMQVSSSSHDSLQVTQMSSG